MRWNRKYADEITSFVLFLHKKRLYNVKTIEKITGMNYYTITKILNGTIKIGYVYDRQEQYIKVRKGRCKNPECRAMTKFPFGVSAYPEIVDKYWYCKSCLIERKKSKCL